MADINLIVATNADKVTGEFNRLGNTVLAQVKKAQQLERGYKDLDRAFNKGQISAQKYSMGIKQVDNAIKQALAGQAQLATATRRTAGAMDTMSAAQAVSTRRMGRGSVITQQAGYQIGDFLVQVQSGTNAFVAFGQQATQVAGTLTILGGKWVLIGTVLGVVIPLVTALGAALARTNTDVSFLADSLDSISPLLDVMVNAATYVKETFLDMANVLVNNLDRIISYGITLSALFAGKLVAAFIAARVASMSLVGSLVLLRGALIRTGIGALVVGAGELVFQFIRLVKAAGGFGAAMVALKDVVVEAFNNMRIDGEMFVLKLKLAFNDLAFNWTQKVGDMRFTWASFVDYLASFEPLGSFGLGLKGGNAAAVAEDQAAAMSATTDEMIKIMDAMRDLEDNSGKSSEALQRLKDLITSLDETGSNIDVRDWFGGGSGDGEESGGAASAVEDLVTQLTTAQQKIQDFADVMKSSMSDAFMSMVEGTKTAKDAFRDMARAIIKQLFDVLVVQQIVGSFNVGTGSGSGIVGSVMGVLGFEGGGYTGSGARSGGIDGKGGFMAMLHPQETVVDHTKGQSAGGGMVVQQTLQFNFSANGDESVKRIIASEAPKIANLAQKQVMDQRRRGGSMKSTFG